MRPIPLDLGACPFSGSTDQMTPSESLVRRVRAEYLEMLGLRVTLAQACRLWQLDAATCEALLESLVREGFLAKTDRGFYAASSGARRQH